MSSRSGMSLTEERVEKMLREQAQRDALKRAARAAAGSPGEASSPRRPASTKSAPNHSSISTARRCMDAPAASSPRSTSKVAPKVAFGSPPGSPPSPTQRLECALEHESLALEPRGSSGAVSSPRSFHGFADPEFYQPLAEESELSPSTGAPVMSWWDRCHLSAPDEILPDFMWLGDKRGALVMNQLPFDTFSHVVFATNELTCPYPARHYLCIKLSDDPDTDLAARFEECNAFVEQARRERDSRVLIHCRMGQSRSSTLVVAYIMSHYKCSLKEALLWTKKHRPAICPNPGFFVQLQRYEKQLFGCPYPSISLSVARKAGVCSVSKLKDKHGNITE